jgi:hypothetical protein
MFIVRFFCNMPYHSRVRFIHDSVSFESSVYTGFRIISRIRFMYDSVSFKGSVYTGFGVIQGVGLYRILYYFKGVQTLD